MPWYDSRIEFAVKNLKKLNEDISVVATDSITSAIKYFDRKHVFNLIVIMSGDKHFEVFDDDFLEKIKVVNNSSHLNLKVLVVQPFITSLLNQLNNNTIEYIRNNIQQLKNYDLMSLFDVHYNDELNTISLN